MNIANIITLLSVATIVTQIALILIIIILIVKKDLLINTFLNKHLNKGLFIVAAIASFGSLFFSQIAKFNPCELCWFQRIFMYPLVFLFGLACYFKDKNIYKYAAPLVIVGWVIALYHNYIYYQGVQNTVCSINNASSCIIPYFTKFGYIGIPIMSLSAFSLLGIMLILLKLNQKKALS